MGTTNAQGPRPGSSPAAASRNKCRGPSIRASRSCAGPARTPRPIASNNPDFAPLLPWHQDHMSDRCNWRGASQSCARTHAGSIPHQTIHMSRLRRYFLPFLSFLTLLQPNIFLWNFEFCIASCWLAPTSVHQEKLSEEKKFVVDKKKRFNEPLRFGFMVAQTCRVRTPRVGRKP